MEVRARAPGKIILSGEHAVVHGSTAVAASVGLCTQTFIRFHESGDELELQFNDLDLRFSWSVARVRDSLPNLEQPFPSSPRFCSLEIQTSITDLVKEDKILEDNPGLSAGVTAFIWLYTCIQGFRPATLIITSDLPLGSGLGSSAALCVSLSAALLSLSHTTIPLDSGQRGWVSFGEGELNLVNKWAFEGEKIIHGKPSGIDNTVSTFGDVIKFKSGTLVRIKLGSPLRMLVTNTRVQRNTKALVAGVWEKTSRYPDAMSAIFTAIDSISNEVCDVIRSGPSDEKEEKLSELIAMNQGLLQSIGVGHASIDIVLQTSQKYKLASKLTGAGGGGCVITLLPSLLPVTVLEKAIGDLQSCGFQCFIAEVGRAGVEVCFDDSL